MAYSHFKGFVICYLIRMCIYYLECASETPIRRHLILKKAEHGEKGLKVLDAMRCKACNVWKTHIQIWKI
ncbi:hypothetical protein PO909_023540 [Leuciscus waleckii]